MMELKDLEINDAVIIEYTDLSNNDDDKFVAVSYVVEKTNNKIILDDICTMDNSDMDYGWGMYEDDPSYKIKKYLGKIKSPLEQIQERYPELTL